MNPQEILSSAREDFRNRRYPDALKNYEYFFDHSLDDDPASFYGVRLSYCLSEWTRLGKKYPPAHVRLAEKAQESLQNLSVTRNPECFHDFVCISNYLKKGEGTVEKFLEYHDSDPELAGLIVRFVWDKLVLDKQWSVCSSYVSSPQEMYDIAIQKFDETMQFSKANPQFGGGSSRSRCVAGISMILVVCCLSCSIQGEFQRHMRFKSNQSEI